MSPGNDRAVANRYNQLRPALLDFLGGQFSRQKQVVPAHDGIFDQPPAGLGDLLVFLLALNEFMAVAEGQGRGELLEVCSRNGKNCTPRSDYFVTPRKC
jgi:hypothetical protein